MRLLTYVVLARGFGIVVDLSIMSTAFDGDVWKNQNFDGYCGGVKTSTDANLLWGMKTNNSSGVQNGRSR